MTAEGRARRIARGWLITFYGVAGLLHVLLPAPFVAIVPAWVPQPHLAVIATGLCEIAGAVGLLVPRLRVAAGWGLALYAVGVFPANIQHAVHDLGGHVGLGWAYHAPRLFLQPLIAWWALWAGGCLDRRK